MATTGLEVFDRTLHTTNLWLDEINAEIGPDRHLAWHVLGAVLRSLRDEMQVEQSAHFAAQLPLLVRGAYFDQYQPAHQPAAIRSQEEFIARIQHHLSGARPVKAEQAMAAVTRTLNRHVTEGQVRKVRDSLPRSVRAMWPEPEHRETGSAASAQSSDQGTSDQGTKAAQAPRRPAALPPEHVAPQPPQHPARAREKIDDVDEIVELYAAPDEEEEEIIARSSRAHVPIGTAGRVHAAPSEEQAASSTRKPKTARTKRKDD
jgi:uncharacterized protein (DUF2267 family)